MNLTDEQLADIKADLHQASGVIDSPDAQYNPAALTAMRRAEKLLAEVKRLRGELAEANAKVDRWRIDLRDKGNDLLNIRGVLSPNGFPRKVPMELVPNVAPAVEWLVAEVERLRRRKGHPGDIAEIDRLEGERDSYKAWNDDLLAEVERLKLAHTTVSIALDQSGQYGRWAHSELERLTAEVADAKRETVRVWALLARARESVRRLTSILIANAGRLDTPFTNADGSPWSLHVKPALDRLQTALGMRGAWPTDPEAAAAQSNTN